MRLRLNKKDIVRALSALCFAFSLVPASAVAQNQDPTLEQMAGQMIVVGFSGTSTSSAQVAYLRDEITAGRLGGVMYLKTNIESLASAKAMNDAFRAASPNLLPFLTLDQEGGKVERLTSAIGFTEVPEAVDIGRGTPAKALATYATMAEGIAALGFNVNFGPVVDLASNPKNPVIAAFGRAFSADPEKVTPFAEAFVKAHRQAGVATALKHFPGHGSSSKDSHEGFVDITQSWNENELMPYRAMVTDDMVDMVMVGHLYDGDVAEAEDGVRVPASLSSNWINGVLRQDIGFDGVVVSDDMEMSAIRAHFSLEGAVTRAVRAGVDVLLFSNTVKPHKGLSREILAILLDNAAKDPAFAARIRQSYQRIVKLKHGLKS